MGVVWTIDNTLLIQNGPKTDSHESLARIHTTLSLTKEVFLPLKNGLVSNILSGILAEALSVSKAERDITVVILALILVGIFLTNTSAVDHAMGLTSF